MYGKRLEVCAAVSPVLAAVLAAGLSLAVNVVPKTWGWAHNELFLWKIVGVIVLVSVAISIVQTWPRANCSQQRELCDPSQAAGTLPPRNPTFTGRAEAQAEMARLLADGMVVVVRGPMGIGKSQLVLEYAHQMRELGRYGLVGWVPAHSRTALVKGLAALAPQLGLSAAGNIAEIAAGVVAALRSRQDWLVIFDNAERLGDLAEMWPGGNGHVVLTSRTRVWGGIAAKIDLCEFSRAESVTFLCRRSGSDEQDAAAELALELDDFPLALAQAAASIDQQSMTIRNYLHLRRNQLLLDPGLDAAEYPVSMAKTLQLRITQLSREQPTAVKLLWLCAFLDPDHIDLDLMRADRTVVGEVLARVLGDSLERARAVGSLTAANLVAVGSDGHLRVPRLVQAAARDKLDHNQTAKQARRALNLIKAVAPTAPTDQRSWPTYASLAPHINVVAECTTSRPQPSDKIRLLRNLGIYFSASKQPGRARVALEDALAVHATAGGIEQTELAKTLDNLSIVYWQLGDLDKALARNERALDIFRTADGPDSAELARAIGNRGVIQLGLGKFEAAQASFRDAWTIFEQVHGPDHPEVARCMANLGIIELARGEFEAAQADLEGALASLREACSTDGYEVAAILMNLSLAQRGRGALRDAQASIEEAVTIIESAFGSEHLEFVAALVSLSIVQRQRRRFRAAYISRKRALTILRTACGHDYDQLSEVLIKLGILQPGKLSSRLISRALTTGLSPQDRQLKVAA